MKRWGLFSLFMAGFITGVMAANIAFYLSILYHRTH